MLFYTKLRGSYIILNSTNTYAMCFCTKRMPGPNKCQIKHSIKSRNSTITKRLGLK